MDDTEWAAFVGDSVRRVQKLNDDLHRQYGLHDFARWHHDGEAGTLCFFNPESPHGLEANVTPIGSFSLNTKTWLWAWANHSKSELEAQRSEQYRALASSIDCTFFSTAHFDCDEFLAWELTAVCVDHFNSVGCYRLPIGHLWVFLALDDIAKVEREAWPAIEA
jgi:hypothetical protein